MILITSGCSFSEIEYDKWWPKWVAEALKVDQHLSSGLQSQGNGLISRKLMYDIYQTLKTTDPQDILVGVMWSEPNRAEIYRSPKEEYHRNISGWRINPVTFPPNDTDGSWIILNYYWDTEHAKNYYRYVFDPVQEQVKTLEHILRVQTFCQLHGIKYFMSSITDSVLAPMQNANTQWLHEQIDFDCFLPVSSCHRWCVDHLPNDFNPDGWHPGPRQHEQFAKQIILPFLQTKYNLTV
jgi:hypothetical protein